MKISKTKNQKPVKTIPNIEGFKVGNPQTFSKQTSDYFTSYNEVLPKNNTKVSIIVMKNRILKETVLKNGTFYSHEKGNIGGGSYDKILRFSTIKKKVYLVEMYKPSLLRKLMLKIPKKVMTFFNLKVPKAKWFKI